MTAAAANLAASDGTLEVVPESLAQGSTRLRDMATAYYANVWRFLRALGVAPHAIDDATQEVFLVAARKLADIRPGADKSFLFSTAVRVARDLRYGRAREELVEDPDDESREPALHATPEDSLDRKEERDLLMSLLDGLNKELRTVLVLFEIEEQPMPEIAKLLGVPVGTVASRLRRAREQFVARLSRHQRRERGGT